MKTLQQKPEYQKPVTVSVDDCPLSGYLVIPPAATAVVIFSCLERNGHRTLANETVAHTLHQVGIGTLILELLTPEEADSSGERLAVSLLTHRLVEASHWLEWMPETSRIGYFGTGIGAVAVLRAAGQFGGTAAVVSCGGRQNLGPQVLDKVKAPALLIAGGLDRDGLMLVKRAYSCLQCEKALHVIAGTKDPGNDPGSLDQVCDLATNWLITHLE